MVLLLDNFDSFTFILNDYLLQCGLQTEVHRNNAMSVAEIETKNYQAIVLSPGPDRPSDSGIMNEVIHAFHTSKPILGICLGHQAIGEYFGAHLIKSNKPMHGKTSLVQHTSHPIFNNLNSFEAMRYHSLLLQEVQTPLQIIAETAAHEIMGIAHESLPIVGLQFHPESILTTSGMILLQNWKAWVKL
jgi:anthranilate synthase/aminodeoxychorismate synthase-like glutamine amidotransferase